MFHRITLTERAIQNVVGSAATCYFQKLKHILDKAPSKRIMGVSLSQLKTNAEKEDPIEFEVKLNKVNNL